MGRPKKIPDPNNPEMIYQLKHIPLDLWLKARAKATAEQTSMREVLVALIRAWVQT